MVRFEKVNKFQYIAKDTDELIEYVNKVVEELSGNSGDFIYQCNRELFHTILSRVLAREFFKVITFPEDVLTIIVDLEHKGIVYTSSFGVVPDPEDNAKVKYVESYYVR
jgi:hypothetical protein